MPCHGLGLLLATALWSAHGQSIDDYLYTPYDMRPPFRILSNHSEIGYGSPSDGLQAALYDITSASTLKAFLDDPPAEGYAVVLSLSLLSKNAIVSLTQYAAAVILPRNHSVERPAAFSPAAQHPNREWSSDPSSTHIWNPEGADLNRKAISCAVMDVPWSDWVQLRAKAAQNRQNRWGYPRHAVQVKAFMWAAHDSQTCLRRASTSNAGFCDPLEGISIFGSPSQPSGKPVVFVATAIDADALVRDSAYGANANTASAVAVLAAMEALSRAPTTAPAALEVMFGLFDGESWGYTGSTKFVADLVAAGASPVVGGLDGKPVNGTEGLLERIKHVIGVDQIGLLRKQDGVAGDQGKLYVHGPSDPAPSAALIADLMATSGVDLAAASPNQGLPPSSVHAFLRHSPQISTAVLSEYDSTYKNTFYGSSLDDRHNYDKGSVVDAAGRIAVLLRKLTHPASTAAELSQVAVNASMVEGMLEFLLPQSECGRFCNDLTTAFRAHGPFSAYTSVAHMRTSASLFYEQFITYVKPLPMVFNGRAIAPGLTYLHHGLWEVADNSQPVFSESRWDATSLEVFHQGHPAMEWVTLIAGCLSVVLHVKGFHMVITRQNALRAV